MGRQPGMTLEQRQVANGLLICSIKASNWTWHFRVHRNTSRLQARHQQTGHVADKPSSGKPRKTAPLQDNYNIPLSRRKILWSSSRIAIHVRNVTDTRM